MINNKINLLKNQDKVPEILPNRVRKWKKKIPKMLVNNLGKLVELKLCKKLLTIQKKC